MVVRVKAKVVGGRDDGAGGGIQGVIAESEKLPTQWTLKWSN